MPDNPVFKSLTFCYLQMSLYRIVYNSYQFTKLLLWIFLMGILQHDMMSIPNILGVTQDESMAVEISQHQFCICQEANGQFCNVYTPLQPLANPPSCITALYAKNAAIIFTRCSLQIRKTQKYQCTLTNCPKCIDTDFSTFYSDNYNNPHLSRRNYKIYYSTETHPHLATTTTLHHHTFIYLHNMNIQN